MSPNGFTSQNAGRGTLIAKLTTHLDSAGTAVGPVFVQLPTALLTAVATAGVLLWLSPLLGGVVLVVAPAAAWLAHVITDRARPRLVEQWQYTAALTAQVEDELSAHRTLQVYGGAEVSGRRFDALNDKLFTATRSAAWTSGALNPLLAGVNMLVFVAMAVIGGSQVVQGSLSLGAAQAAVFLASQLTTAVRDLAGLSTRIQSGSVAAAAVRELDELPGETDPSCDAPAPPASGRHRRPPRIEFDAVDFAYTADRPVLEQVSFTIEPGTTTAVIGSTGSGKTTLTSLLQAFHTPAAGRIRIDGEDITDLGRAATRSLMAVVAQEPWLLRGTVAENIGYGLRGRDRDPATEARRITEAVADARLEPILALLPDGLDTRVGDDDAGLSAGEQQLITVARALAARPAILVLDEATSAADPRTELLIQQALGRLRSRTTSLVITHRMTTAAQADRIVVLEGGRVVEQGSPAELLAAGGVYARRCRGDEPAVPAPGAPESERADTRSTRPPRDPAVSPLRRSDARVPV